jgi:hypothetical protein
MVRPDGFEPPALDFEVAERGGQGRRAPALTSRTKRHSSIKGTANVLSCLSYRERTGIREGQYPSHPVVSVAYVRLQSDRARADRHATV